MIEFTGSMDHHSLNVRRPSDPTHRAMAFIHWHPDGPADRPTLVVKSLFDDTTERLTLSELEQIVEKMRQIRNDPGKTSMYFGG